MVYLVYCHINKPLVGLMKIHSYLYIRKCLEFNKSNTFMTTYLPIKSIWLHSTWSKAWSIWSSIESKTTKTSRLYHFLMLCYSSSILHLDKNNNEVGAADIFCGQILIFWWDEIHMYQEDCSLFWQFTLKFCSYKK